MEDYRLTVVYKKGDAIISLYEDDDHDFIYISDSRDKIWMKVPEWDYDIDEYDHIDGMQKYFDYCIEHQITCDLLEALFHEEIPDIYEYKYSNEEVMQR